MKRITSKVLNILIIFILLIAYIFPIMSFANSNFTTYVALGDSIAYGYGLANRDNDSYTSKVRQKYNISQSNFQNLAVSGMTCAEYYEKIQEEEYTNAIENADLLTVSIGSNELLGLVTKAVSDVTGVPIDSPNFVEEAQNVFLSASMLEKIKMLTEIYNTFTSEEMKLQIEASINTYKDNWSKSIQYIKEINPDITIVATEFYNPYYEISLGSYDLGGFVDENIQKMNEILHENSNSESEYKIAKIYDAFNTTNPRLTNVNISMSDLNVDPHPNVLGHEVICTKIMDALVDADNKKDISELTINDIKDQVYTGEGITPKVTIKDGNTQLVENRDFTVSYSDNVNIGEAKVTIIGIGNYEGKVIKTFNITNSEQKDISSLNINQLDDETYTGIKITPDVEITDGDYRLSKNTDYELSYENNINVGTAKVTIRGIGNYTGTRTLEFNIVQKDINLVTIKDIGDQVHTGEEIEPSVMISDGSAKLVEDKDYNISYSNNVDLGEATITITGIGNYTGTVTKNFNIVEESGEQAKDISELTIDEIGDKIYTGKLITPELRIKDGDTVLIKNEDYTINYTNNINVGTANAVIKGIGNYTGQVEKQFNIVRKDINYTTILDIPDQIYTGQSIEADVVIESDGIVLNEGEDYIIEYINNQEVGTATIRIEGMGNYTGTMTKTFNIVEADSNSGNQNTGTSNNGDDTVADKIIPFAGENAALIILFVVLFTVAVTTFIWLKKNKDFK